MNWSEITNDWPTWAERMRQVYPYLEARRMRHAPENRHEFEEHLAATHNLSLDEAHEEVEDFLVFRAPLQEQARSGRYSHH